MDLVLEEKRTEVFNKRKTQLESNSGNFQIKCYPTSIWEASLYKAWTQIVSELSPNKDEIEKVISILIDNAIKHSNKNTNIDIILTKVRNNIVIKVINEGDGIKPGEEELIFERFYRSDKSRNRDSNRYGRGLAIAKNIVEVHKGTIKAYTKDNKTIFEIIFK